MASNFFSKIVLLTQPMVLASIELPYEWGISENTRSLESNSATPFVVLPRVAKMLIDINL